MNKMIKMVVLVCVLSSFMLVSCGVKSSCVLQAVAGGSQYCQDPAEEEQP